MARLVKEEQRAVPRCVVHSRGVGRVRLRNVCLERRPGLPAVFAPAHADRPVELLLARGALVKRKIEQLVLFSHLVDGIVGTVVDKLEGVGVSENTLILFTGGVPTPACLPY